MEERSRLIEQTHQIVAGKDGKQKLIVNNYELYFAIGKPDIHFQNGKFFINKEEATIEEVEAQGFNTKTKKYSPDQEVLKAIVEGTQSATKTLAGRAARQSVGTK